MLQRIRDNASGPIAYAVVGLITLVFGVWGIGSYFTPSANPVVASVGDIDITRYQLQQAYNQRYRQLQTLMGERFEPGMIEPQQLRHSILQRLIRAAVLDQYAVDAGYRTTDAALLQVITSNPQFRVGGQFSSQRYRTLLANAGLEPAAYEARLRRDIVSRQVRAGVVNSAFVAPPAVVHAYSLRHQKRKLAWLVFPADAYKDQVEVTADDIAAWYDSHGDRYMRPERVKLAYVELNRNALNARHAVTEKRLRSLYTQNKSRFTTPDRRAARQIFVPVTPDNAAAARQRIQTIADKLAHGQSFDDIAANSPAPVQVTQLDNVSRADVPGDVAAALFNLDIGQISSPIRGDKGWYLLKATAAQPGETKPFSAPRVQKQLKKMARRQWRNRRFSELAERMETLAFQAPNGLETLARELDFTIEQTGWITRSAGQGLGQYRAVRQAAFSDAVLRDGLNSTAIQIGTDRRVVLRVVAHQGPQQIPLSQVRDKIRRQLMEKKAQALAHEAAQAARQKLAAGASVEAIAADTPARLKTPGYIGRTATDVPQAVREAAFALPEPAGGGAAYDVVRTADGDAALVALRDVETATDLDADNIEPVFVQRQRAYVAQLEYAAFADYLRAHADIELNEEQLDFK